MDFAYIPNNYVAKVRKKLLLSNSGTMSYEF